MFEKEGIEITNNIIENENKILIETISNYINENLDTKIIEIDKKELKQILMLGKRELNKIKSKYKPAEGNGQGSCYLCEEKGKWNREWVSMMYRDSNTEKLICSNCYEHILKGID